jgi:transposase
MSKPMAEPPKNRRPRRRFDDEFKAQAVRLVLDEGQTVGAAARDLDLTETALREWVKRARADRTKGRTGLTSAEREELVQLRKENRQLRLEREILKNAAAFFAKEPATRLR